MDIWNHVYFLIYFQANINFLFMISDIHILIIPLFCCTERNVVIIIS